MLELPGWSTIVETTTVSVAEPKSTRLPESVDPLNEPAWDERVQTHTECCFFHGSAWPRVLQEAYGQKPLYLAVRDKGSISALLPITNVRSPVTGCRGVSLAFADLCPPLSPDQTTYRQLLQHALSHGRALGWRYLECRGGLDLLDGVPSWMAFYGHTLDLSRGEDALLKRFEGRVRNALRKAEGSGVKVEISGNPDPLRDFYRLHCQTRRKHGVPPQPWAFFESIHRNILAKGSGVVAVARLQDEPVAGAVFFHLGKRVIYKYSASEKSAQQLRPNNLVLWEAIRWYARAGFAEMHFGRTSLANEGLRLYKRGFGTAEHQIRYFRYDFRRKAFLSGSEKPPGWMNRACGLLPLSLLRLAGRLLYRHAA